MPYNQLFNHGQVGYDNPTNWNSDYSRYAAPSASERGNQVSGTFLDPFGDVSGLYNDLMGFTSQSREFQQQEYMTDKENWWNSAPEAMKRAVDAGINPNTAAAGIVGAGNLSVAPAAGAASPAGNPLDSAAGIAQTASNIGLQSSQSEKALADAEKARADARNADRLADADILSKAGNFAKALTESGTPEIAAMELALKVVRGGLDGISNSLKGDGICRLIQTRQDQIESDYSKTFKEIEQIEKMLPLIIDEQEKKNALLDIEKRKQNAITLREQQLTDLWSAYNGDPYLDLWQRQYQIFHDFGADSVQYKSFLDLVKNFNYFQSFGQNLASMEIDWLRPPTSAVEASAKAGHAIGDFIKSLRSRGLSDTDAKAQALSNPAFLKAYDEARQKLKDDYEAKKKRWKQSRGMNDSERAQRYRNYQEAMRIYDEFDKDAFFQMTWSNPLFSPAH